MFGISVEVDFRSREDKKIQKKKLYVLLGSVVIILVVTVVLLWYTPTYFQTPTNSFDESSYTKMKLRDEPFKVDAVIIEFGDTEYSFRYSAGYLMVFDPLQSMQYKPTVGETYSDLGIEIKVSKVGSDYISRYIEILVKPTTQNYMASLNYTKVRIALYETKAVNISGSLINKTNQYWFTYTQVRYATVYEPRLTIGTTSQSKEYNVSSRYTIRGFEIETRVYRIESEYIVIYVKPLY